MTLAEARRALVDAGRRLMAEGLVARSWGNVSVRLDAGSMAVTPSGILWNDLTEAMISVVDLETGDWKGDWKPSGERKVHREIYRRRPEVGAVVHTHQSAASVWAAARVPFGDVPCAPYALPGTKALTQGTVDALGEGEAVLMANHGVFTVGADLEAAFQAVARLERACADKVAERGLAPLPGRVDEPWNPGWLRPLAPVEGVAAWFSEAPFTRAWAQRGRVLPGILDDLAQFAGPRVRVVSNLPTRRPAHDVVLMRGSGAVVLGPDAEALAMVVEKAARAVLGAEGLGGAKAFPAWEARLMRFVYAQSYAKQAKRTT